MGAGASTLPAAVDKPTAKTFAGDRFDEKAFDAAAKDGVVAKDDFLKAAEKVRRAAARPTTVASKCAILCAKFDERRKEAIAAELSREESARLATKAFWEEQECEPYWTVPMGGDSQFARCCGLLDAVKRAQAAGKTPLLIDNSEDRLIDTFYSYQQVQVLEAKRMVLDEAKGTARAAVLERARVQLVNAMRFGQVLYVRLANTACDFSNKYSGADTLPLELFDASAVALLNEKFGSAPADVADEQARHVGANLWEAAEDPFAATLRAEDAAKGAFVPRRGFEVILCTHFGAEDATELLSGKLPMEKLQPIAGVQLAPPGGTQACSECEEGAAKAAAPSVEEMLAPVEAACEEATRLNSKPSKDALEAAIRTVRASPRVSILHTSSEVSTSPCLPRLACRASCALAFSCAC